jgi:hypothetical protein
MATYKVIQDIEAEDKLIGPLTLRQFIYAAIACVAFYLSFIAISKHFAFMLVLFLPVGVLAGFFAFPWKGEQPTEVWALAKIRFMLKPRKRIWDQSGAKELVTVTAPKRVHVDYTNGLSQNEVRSRLRALADTIDSRGWAIKNSNVNTYTQPALVLTEPTSDRLLGPSVMPQDVEAADIQAADDMLDETNNRVAQQVDNMIEASAKAHRDKIVESLSQNAQEPAPQPDTPKKPVNNYWFLNQAGQSSSVPSNMVTFNTQVVTPGTDEDGNLPGSFSNGTDEKQLLQTLEERKRELPMSAYYGHLHTIQPLSAQNAAAPTQAPERPVAPAPTPVTQDATQPPTNDDSTQQPTGQPTGPDPQPTPMPNLQPPVTPTQQAAILQLASNDDLNVATLAREAKRSGLSDGEVVINLH